MARKRQTTVVRQAQIISAARRLIIKYGSEHVTVNRIAREVGFSEAAIYRHFKSKKDILSFLVDHIKQNLSEDIAQTRVEGQTALQQLEKVLRSHISAEEQRHGISFQVIAEIVSLGDKKLNRKLSLLIDEYIDSLRALLQEAAKSGEIREDLDLQAAATLLFSMIQGLVNVWALSNYQFDPEERYTGLWKTYYQAIARR